MKVQEFFDRFSSDTASGSANQVEARFDECVQRRGELRYRLTCGGNSYAFLFSNIIDSTFSDGSITRAGDVCGEWDILSLRAGIAHEYSSEPEYMKPVTFEGSESLHVVGDMIFASDEVMLEAKKGDYLVYEITVCGQRFPYHHEITLKSVTEQDGRILRGDNRFPVPLCIGSSRPVDKRVGFIGDSITQGCGTEADSYTHWVSVIAEGLDDDRISVWDLGIGYARAYDAASCGFWLERASHCDIVNVCFGVNDLLRCRNDMKVIEDLNRIVDYLKSRGCRVILFTLPPFDLTGDAKDYWYSVNDYIRKCDKADEIFDFAEVLGQKEYMHRSRFGGHPNAEGCLLAGKTYLERIKL